MIRLQIAEHHQLVREGIAGLLRDEPRVEVCHHAADTESLLRGLRERGPQVTLLDLHLPRAGGLEALRRALRVRAEARIVCMGVNRHGPHPARLLEMGAAGVLTMGCSRDELLEALQAVVAGRTHVGADLARTLLEGGYTAARQPVAELSARELAVMALLSEGRRLKEISDQLCISTKTVSTYRSRVCRKLGVRTDVELTHLSLQHGLIESRYCS